MIIKILASLLINFKNVCNLFPIHSSKVKNRIIYLNWGYWFSLTTIKLTNEEENISIFNLILALIRLLISSYILMWVHMHQKKLWKMITNVKQHNDEIYTQKSINTSTASKSLYIWNNQQISEYLISFVITCECNNKISHH